MKNWVPASIIAAAILAGCSGKPQPTETVCQEGSDSLSLAGVKLLEPSARLLQLGLEKLPAKKRGNTTLTNDDLTLAGIHLGDTAEQVKKVLGEPAEVTVAKGLGIPLWRYPKQGIEIGFSQIGETAGPVIYLAASEGFTGQTHRGIRLGATESDVIKAYGPVQINRLNNTGAAEITEGDRRIQFSFADGVVTHIRIDQGL